jgi:hypothetical protein
VNDRLAAKGHRAYTPTLTGVADRSHLLSESVNLSTHITDMSGLPPGADIARPPRHVRKVPMSDIERPAGVPQNGANISETSLGKA